MKVRPINGQVLLRETGATEQTAGGIYLPDTAREEPSEGIIEALPSGAHYELAVGDRVAYRAMAGEEVTLEGDKYRLVSLGDLLGKYVEADAIP